MPTWVDLYGAPAHFSTHDESSSRWVRNITRTLEGTGQELARKMNSGLVPGSTYRGRILIAVHLQDVDEARTDVTRMPGGEHLQPGRRARQLGDLMGLRLEALVSTTAKQLAMREDGRPHKLPRSQWRLLRR